MNADISAVQIVSGTGAGEVHVNHGGALIGFDKELKVLAAELGGISVHLSEEFWVFHDPNVNESSSNKVCKKIKKLIQKK